MVSRSHKSEAEGAPVLLIRSYEEAMRLNPRSTVVESIMPMAENLIGIRCINKNIVLLLTILFISVERYMA